MRITIDVLNQGIDDFLRRGGQKIGSLLRISMTFASMFVQAE